MSKYDPGTDSRAATCILFEKLDEAMESTRDLEERFDLLLEERDALKLQLEAVKQTRCERMDSTTVERFTENAEKAGLFTRHYQGGEVYQRALARAASIIWEHMCTLDLVNIKGWMGCAALANVWAESSWSGGARKFGPEDNR